jgi:hypothetical protein
VPAALANATTLVSARGRWGQHLICRTSMHDLLFTRPGDEYPFEASVRVHAQGSSLIVEETAVGDRTQSDCTADDVDRVLDEALERLAEPRQICRACGEAVATPQFATFERMHWVCFHFEFEHSGADRDASCTDPGCPMA